MNWHLMKAQDGVLLCGFSSHGAFPTNTGKYILGLLSGSWKKEFPLGETLLIANIFLCQFGTTNGEFPCHDFRHLDGFTLKCWWVLMTRYLLKTSNKYLVEIGLCRAIRAVQYGIPTSLFYFFCLLKLYNPDTGTFFTLFGELGLCFLRYMKFWDYQYERSYVKNMRLQEKSCICFESSTTLNL